MPGKYKYKGLRILEKVVEPKLYTMQFNVYDKLYLRSAAAYSLEDAVKSVKLVIDSKYYSPSVSEVYMWDSISIDEIKNKFRNVN